jgi:hypothetical protein
MTAQVKKDDVQITREETNEFSPEELRGVYSRLFTHPDVQTGREERAKICGLLREQNTEEMKRKLDQALSNHYNTAARPQVNRQCALSATQMQCLHDLFMSDGYKNLRMIDDGKPAEPTHGVLTAGPWEMAFIYHSLFGKPEEDDSIHKILNGIKKAAVSELSEAERREAIKAGLKDAYNKPLAPEARIHQLNVRDEIISEIIQMHTIPAYKELEPYESTEPCKVGDKLVFCY